MYVHNESIDGCGPCVIRVDANLRAGCILYSLFTMNRATTVNSRKDEYWLAITSRLYMNFGLWNRNEVRC